MKNKIPLVSPAERANFEKNKEMFYAAKKEALAFFETSQRDPLHMIFEKMFGRHGTHRRLYDPKTNGWRAAFRDKNNVFGDIVRG